MSHGNLGTAVSSKIDVNAIVRSLQERTPAFRSAIEEGVRSAVTRSTTSQLLTISVKTPDGTIRLSKSPSLTPEYAKLLGSYLSNTPHPQGQLSAGIEDVVQTAAKEAASGFYQSDDIIKLLSEQLVAQVAQHKDVQRLLLEELKSQVQWLRREFKDSARLTGRQIVADRLLDTLSSAVSQALHTSGGTVLVGLLTKVLAYPAVKTAIVHSLMTALGSAAVQKALVLAMKKAGIGVLVHLVLAKLGVTGGAAISVGWIVAPIIGGIVLWEYTHLPGKLGEKIAPEVAKKLAEEAPGLHRQVVEKFVRESISSFTNTFTSELRRKLTEEVGLRGKGSSTLKSDLFDSFLAAR